MRSTTKRGMPTLHLLYKEFGDELPIRLKAIDQFLNDPTISEDRAGELIVNAHAKGFRIINDIYLAKALIKLASRSGRYDW